MRLVQEHRGGYPLCKATNPWEKACFRTGLCLNLAPDHLSSAARNIEDWSQKRHSENPAHGQNNDKILNNVGWLMGLEPTTTGITIRGSTC